MHDKLNMTRNICSVVLKNASVETRELHRNTKQLADTFWK